MAGIQEILVLVIIILAIFFVPRVMGRRQETEPVKAAVAISGKMRLAIAASIFWAALTAAFLKPWHGDRIAFLYVGFGPVILGWSIYWVVVGYRSGKR